MKKVILILLCIYFADSFAQGELEINFNAPIIPLGNYAKSDLFYGMETIGYAEVGYGFDLKYLHKLKNSRFKIGANISHFQNSYKFKKLDFAFNNYLGCDEEPFSCGFQNYFGWDVLYRVTDWKTLDLNLISSINILEFKKIQYNILVSSGATMHISPKYYYNIGFDDELEGHISFNFNIGTEQNLKIKLTENLFFNTSIFYRVSKVHSKFTKNLISDYVYYDFWQHTLGTKVGLVYVFNKRVLNK